LSHCEVDLLLVTRVGGRNAVPVRTQ
jgi:hypothetical protein